MKPLFEAVPNVSEGQDHETIAACARAIREAGAYLAHQTSDPHHHRSVFTIFGDEPAIIAAAAALAKVCVNRIDLRRQRGAHPRIGALDVFPVVPIAGADLRDATRVARVAAAAIWAAAGVPSLYYGEGSGAPERHLPFVRRGGFEALAERAAAGERADCGDVLFHPSAGTAAVGAREVLIALNILLHGAGIGTARRIARVLRESNGGFRTLRCLGIQAGGAIQVSCNLTDAHAFPLHRLLETIRLMAAREGAAVSGCELIGLVPRGAIERLVRDAFGGDGLVGENGQELGR